MGPLDRAAELAELERAGYLDPSAHSAGTVPTDAGYRFYADSLLASGRRAAGAARAAASISTADAPRGGRGDARDDRRAVADHGPARRRDRPARGTARIHRVEVLLLQPRVVMVVVIASNGAA